MSDMRIETGHKNETTHTAVFDQALIAEILARHVASAVGVDLDRDGVSYVMHLQVNRYGSSEAVIRIRADHTKLPQVAA